MSPGFGILVLCVCPFLHCCREKSFDFRLYRSSSSFPLKVLLPKVVQFSLVAQSCPTFCDPMNRSTPGLPVHHQLPEFTSIESVMPSSHLILSRPLLLLPPIPPSVRVFSNESTLRMRWPKYWSFSLVHSAVWVQIGRRAKWGRKELDTTERLNWTEDCS